MIYSKYYFQPLNTMRLLWGKVLSRGLYKCVFVESTPRKLGSYLSRRVFMGWSLQPMPSVPTETHVRQTWAYFEIVTGRMNVLKMAIQPKTISRSYAIATRIPMIFSTDSEQIWTFVWPQRVNAMLSRKNTAGNITLAHLKLYSITVTKSAWCWNKTYLETDQQNAIDKNRHGDRPMEHARRSSGKPIQLWPFNFWQWYQKHIEKKRALSINGVSNGGCPSAEKWN